MKASKEGEKKPGTALVVTGAPIQVLRPDKMSDAVSLLVEGKKTKVKLHLEYQDPLEVELTSFLKSRVLGQEEAMVKIAKTVSARIAQAGDREAPLAVIYAGGPTGVGKTETAVALSEFFLGISKGYTKIEGNDYQDHHTSRNLFGSPKSYVGYDDPPKLNEADLHSFHRKALESGKTHQTVSALSKFAIVLIDEADKMHYSICQNFLGIFDKGEFELPTGSESDTDLAYSKFTDFRQTIFILTSNAGEVERREQLDKNPMGFAPVSSSEAKHEQSEEVIKKVLKGKFSPEFTERIDLFLSYKPLTVHVAEGIARREIDKLRNGFVKRRTGNSVAIDVRPETVTSLAKAGLDPLRGARNFNRFIEDRLIMPLRNVFLSGQLSGVPEGKTATLKVEGEYDALSVTLSGLRKKEMIHSEAVASLVERKRNTIIGRIEDVHAKVEAYRRIYELAFLEHFSMTTEAARLERELLSAGIPQEEIEAIRDEVVESIDRLERERNELEEALGTENVPYSEPGPDTVELFYPISPEAIMEVVRFYVIHAEKELKKPGLTQLRNGLIMHAINEACSKLMGKPLSKDQYDHVAHAAHEVYLRMKAKTR